MGSDGTDGTFLCGKSVPLFDPLPEVDPLDRMRRTGVGVEDVIIVGNPGPTGIPPGEEAEGGLLVDDPEGRREAET